MFEYLKFAIKLVSDTIKERSLAQLFHQQVFYHRAAIPVVLDLPALKLSKDPLAGPGYRFEELRRKEIEAGRWAFLVDNRRLDALRNIKFGLRGFALVKNENEVVGDIWCVTPREPNRAIRHQDLEMLHIACAKGDVYALDMFIAHEYRGKKLAAPLHRSLQLVLQQEGWQKLYAYYWEDNLPSKWMHWMLKFNEMPKVYVSRFFFVKRTHKPI